MTTRIPTSGHVNATADTEHKVYENRLRRAADRQGLRLMKSRRRDPQAYDFGTYMLVDVDTTGVIHGDRQKGYGLSLTDVADCLFGGDES